MLSAIFSWSSLWWIMLIIYIPACLGLIAMVLLQKGKGSGFAGAFGVGPGSETVFGHPESWQIRPLCWKHCNITRGKRDRRSGLG